MSKNYVAKSKINCRMSEIADTILPKMTKITDILLKIVYKFDKNMMEY
jgi:hypothetical protein